MEQRFTRIMSSSFTTKLKASLLGLLCMASLGSSAQTYLSEGFESSTFPPTGWTRAILSGSYNWARQSSGYSSYPYNVPAHGGSYYAWYNSWNASSGSKAELRTPSMNFSSASSVRLSFWFYRQSASTGYTDNMDVYVNTSATSTGGTLLGNIHHAYNQTPSVPTAGWYQYTYTIPGTYNGTANYIIFKDNSSWGPDAFLDDVQVYNLGPCTGPSSTPVLNITGTQTVCPGTTVHLVASGYTLAGNITMGWQYSLNSGTTWNTVPGATTDNYTTFPLTKSTMFRFLITCQNTLDSVYSLATTFNLTGGGSFPQYASLPFFEDFESWSSGCGTSDLPSNHWTNIPSTGNPSWRRDDQGSTASWTSPTSGTYTPSSFSNSHSARFHAYYATGRSQEGDLSLYVNCSGANNKELEFYSRLDNNANYPNDSLIVEYSPDAGITWNTLAKYGGGNSTGGWDYHGGIPLPSTSATTIIRFSGSQNYGYSTGSDIYLDAVRVFPACTGKPNAGTIDSVDACSGKDFTLKLSGTSQVAGLTFLWQYRPTSGATTVWNNLAGGNVPRPTANITAPTSFRCIVTCSYSGQSDTSAAFNVMLSPFYYCYCDVGLRANYPYQYGGIGNVSVESDASGAVMMSNGNPLPTTNNPTATAGYKSFARTVPAPYLIRDTTYKFSITVATPYSYLITGSYTYAHIYLDINRNGVWDLPGERIMAKSWSTSGQKVSASYKIPSNAPVGLTGMRAIAGYYPMYQSSIGPYLDPCGDFYYESAAEDYLVYIQYQPCNGAVGAGTSYASDSLVCPNYTVDLWNTTYQQDRTGIVRDWEMSTNTGASYSVIAGSHNKDTMLNVVVPSSPVYGIKYRLRTVCSNTGDTTYSNAVQVMNPPANDCYPYAAAVPPGTKDSSDIGTFMIGNVDSPHINPAPIAVVGPHLMNPAAIRGFTNYSHISPTWVLAADSVYRIGIYHIMRSATHADALVSVYIDFNHDHLYTQASPGYPFPSELVYRGTTTASHFFLDTTFTMPSALIPGVPTGLRVILNNDLNPNGSGNTGVGGFVSGEVEDYSVILGRTNVGVNGTGALINKLALFPNPTAQKATLVFDASRIISKLDVTVTTIAGQRVMSESFSNVSKHFQTEIDLTGQAKGIYFVVLKTDDGQKIVNKLVLQ